MNFVRLQYFIDVAECQSFTKAARKNYIAQTAVSQQIQALEKEVGCRLFDRLSGKIILTDSGQCFYKYSCMIMNTYKELEEEVCEIKKRESNEF